MTTRNPSKVDFNKDCTEFQMHKTMHPMFDQLKKKLIDFTEHKLTRYLLTIEDPQQREMLMNVIDRYRRGLVAVAWKKGRPVHVDLTKEK